MQNKKDINCPIKNTCIYEFKDGTYFVSFNTRYGREEIKGSRQFVAQKLALRVKSLLRLR